MLSKADKNIYTVNEPGKKNAEHPNMIVCVCVCIKLRGRTIKNNKKQWRGRALSTCIRWSLNNTVKVAISGSWHAQTLHSRPTQIRHRSVSAAGRRIVEILTDAGCSSTFQRSRWPAGCGGTTQCDVTIQLALSTSYTVSTHKLASLNPAVSVTLSLTIHQQVHYKNASRCINHLNSYFSRMR